MDGEVQIAATEWEAYRAKFKCPVGVTNVWRHPQVGGAERINGVRSAMQWKYKSLHGSQKPLDLVGLSIELCTEPGDMVWEPFGGLCPAAICAFNLERSARSAEIAPEFYEAATRRLDAV